MTENLAQDNGWAIGKTVNLKIGGFFYKSVLDSEKPWESEWEKNVIVDCIATDKDSISCVIDSNSSSLLCFFCLLCLLQLYHP